MKFTDFFAHIAVNFSVHFIRIFQVFQTHLNTKQVKRNKEFFSHLLNY